MTFEDNGQPPLFFRFYEEPVGSGSRVEVRCEKHPPLEKWSEGPAWPPPHGVNWIRTTIYNAMHRCDVCEGA